MNKHSPRQDSAGLRLSKDDLPELASLAQFGEVMGLSVPQVRALIDAGRLEYIEIGRRLFVPRAAIPRFIAENTVQPCRDETQGRVSASYTNEAATTSAGPSRAAAGSAARARQIANELKLRSRNSSTDELANRARVIPLKS
jgi:hypothetical protein